MIKENLALHEDRFRTTSLPGNIIVVHVNFLMGFRFSSVLVINQIILPIAVPS